jgi:hypothetical protein
MFGVLIANSHILLIDIFLCPGICRMDLLYPLSKVDIAMEFDGFSGCCGVFYNQQKSLE